MALLLEIIKHCKYALNKKMAGTNYKRLPKVNYQMVRGEYLISMMVGFTILNRTIVLLILHIYRAFCALQYLAITIQSA